MKELRNFTLARVGLGRSGNSLPTRALLDFQLAHAQARDAVHYPFDPAAMLKEIEAAGWPAVAVKSAALDRMEYLRRPDLGRKLSAPSKAALEELRGPFDVAFIVADGLAALAVHRHAIDLLRCVIEPNAWTIAPIVVASQARVALGDEIGAALNASLTVMLIGERPGLSSPASLGVYLTWSPRPGRTDAERNCISNIRPEGLAIGAAGQLLLLLMNQSRARQLSGVAIENTLPFSAHSSEILRSVET
jgi:ethanolamine ammonia-lyase small subunit